MKTVIHSIKKRPGTWLISSLMLFQMFWLIHYHEYYKGKHPWPFISDGLGYYSYLPALFIYDDSDLDWEWSLKPELKKYTYPPVIQYFGPYKSEETGKYVMKYPPGMSIIHAPMFLLAHALAEPLGHEPNGFTNPYRLGGGLTAIIWMILGLTLIWKWMRLYFSPAVAALTVLTYYFGTNYFHYALSEPGMTHLYNFAAIAGVMYCTDQWHRNGKWKYILGLGLALGMIGLLRPTNALVLLVPLLWMIDKPREKWGHIYKHRWKVVGGIALCFLVMSPLLLYWKIWGGSWIFSSYGPEQFYWGQPMISEVLFGYHKGWFVYTPLMLLAVAGLWALKKKAPESFWAIVAYLIVNIYVVSCWWSWWYGGSLGMRSLIETSAALALGFGATFSWFSKVKWRYALLGIILLAGMSLNILQTYQYDKFIIDPADMTKTVYWDVFLRPNIPEGERYRIHKNLIEPDSMRYWQYHPKD